MMLINNKKNLDMNDKIKKINICFYFYFFFKKIFNMLCFYKFFLFKYIIFV